MKLCKDCKHYIPADKHVTPKHVIEFSRCRKSPKDSQRDATYLGYDDGDEAYTLCSISRNIDWFGKLIFGYCGRKGRYWEAK